LIILAPLSLPQHSMELQGKQRCAHPFALSHRNTNTHIHRHKELLPQEAKWRRRSSCHQNNNNEVKSCRWLEIVEYFSLISFDFFEHFLRYIFGICLI